MKMSNPVFSSIDNIDWHRSLRQSNTGTVTMDDVIQKTSITLGIIVASAAANFALAWVVPPLASLLSLIGAIGALVMVLVSTFGNKFESAGVTIAYAVFEGLMLGGMSTVIASTYTAKWGMVVGQALLGTIAVFIVMLIVYRMKLIEVTKKFKSFIIVMLLGGAVPYPGFRFSRTGSSIGHAAWCRVGHCARVCCDAGMAVCQHSERSQGRRGLADAQH